MTSTLRQSIVRTLTGERGDALRRQDDYEAAIREAERQYARDLHARLVRDETARRNMIDRCTLKRLTKGHR